MRTAGGFLADGEIDRDARERDRVRERDQLGGALGRLHRGDARHARGRRPSWRARRRSGAAWPAACAMRPEAIATRWVAGLAPTSTMWAEPLASKWVNDRGVVIPGAIINRCGIAAFLIATAGPARPAGAGRRSLPDLGGERRCRPFAAARAAHRREHHARDPLPRAELHRRRRDRRLPASLGGRLTQAHGRRAPRLRVLRRSATTPINAFALPGGFIGVHTGLLPAAESESEVASVLGARDGARHPAPHRAHARPAAADAAAGARGARRRDPARALAAGPGERRGRRRLGRRDPDAAQLLARLRARGRPHRLPVARGGRLRRARDGHLLREDAARQPHRRRRHACRATCAPTRSPPSASPMRRTAPPACPTSSIPTARNSSWCAPSCAPSRATRAIPCSSSSRAVRERRFAIEAAARYGLTVALRARASARRKPKPSSRACAPRAAPGR